MYVMRTHTQPYDKKKSALVIVRPVYIRFPVSSFLATTPVGVQISTAAYYYCNKGRAFIGQRFWSISAYSYTTHSQAAFFLF